MGLDTYAVIGEDTTKGEAMTLNEYGELVAKNKLFDGINLCGGMFSGGGASFRGKVYASLVERVTGISLYEDRITGSQVEKIADELRKYVDHAYMSEHKTHEMPADSDWDISFGEVEDLQQWFQVCVDNGYDVVSWY